MTVEPVTTLLAAIAAMAAAESLQSVESEASAPVAASICRPADRLRIGMQTDESSSLERLLALSS